MSQQTPYAPRWARVIGRSGTLIGILAVLSGLAGAIIGALGTQTYMTVQTVLVATPTCAAAGAICGGPAFSSGTAQLVKANRPPGRTTRIISAAARAGRAT